MLAFLALSLFRSFKTIRLIAKKARLDATKLAIVLKIRIANYASLL